MQIAKKSTREIIYEALVDSYNTSQRAVTRETLNAITGIKKTTIDEHLDKLVNDEGSVIRVDRGFYEPVIRFPETRAISKTVLPGGLVKLDIADRCLDLTPAENRIMKELFGGGNEFHEAEAMQQSRALIAQQAVILNRLQREVSALREHVREMSGNVPQMHLELTS